MRVFKGGATRDISNGKVEYTKFTHPLCEHSFGKYMLKHQRQSDGTLRKGDNWWAGWDKSVSLESLQRHVMDLRAIQAGYRVFKARVINDFDEEVEETFYTKEQLNTKYCVEISEEDCCNAIRFNADAYKLQII